MHFTHQVQSRTIRVWIVLITVAILLILIAAMFLQSRRSPQPFEMDDLYGLLD